MAVQDSTAAAGKYKEEEQMMRKILAVLLMTCFFTTTWATAGSLENKLKTAEITTVISARDMLLEDFLALLTEQSGVNILAVPEVAGMTVSIQTTPKQTLNEVLTTLSNTYQLTFQLNEKKNAIIILKGSSYEGFWSAPVPNLTPTMLAKTAERQMIVAYAPPGRYNPTVPFNTEEYKNIQDNNYQLALNSPVSTFSIDVDTASYSNVRRFINSGSLPQKDAVRTEEMINYFTYDYQEPTGEHPFSVTTEVAECPWQSGHRLVMIGLKGKNIQAEELPPSNLTFLVDVSGSMAEPNKLPLLKTALKMLVQQLRPQDKVSIVVYAGQAGLVLEPTSGSEKNVINKAIDSLQAGGSTAGGEGIKLAYKIAKGNYLESGNNRVILATDGDFNVGLSSEGELTRMIEERRNDGIFLSVLGFGMGNIKDNKMEALADKGNGNYAYIDNALEAKKVMVGQMAGTLYTIAKDVKLQVEFNPAKVKAYRLIGYENRVMDNRDFNDDKKDAGDMGAGHSVTALYEIIPAESDEITGSVDSPVYQRTEIIPSDDLLQVKIRYKKPAEDVSVLFVKRIGSQDISAAPSDDFKFAAAVGEYAMLLRDSEFKGQATYRQVLELAKHAKGKDVEGYRAEFIRMVEISQLLDEK